MMQKMLTIVLSVLTVWCCKGTGESAEEAVAAPQEVKVTAVGETAAKLEWSSKGEGVTGWWVYKRTETDGFHVKPVNFDAPLAPGVREYVFDALEVGKSYDFGVQALAEDSKRNSAVIYAQKYMVPDPNASTDPEPSEEPSAEPSTEPSAEPSSEPSAEPSGDPGADIEVSMKVNQEDLKVEFSSKSLSGEDLLVTLAPVSANKTVQIDRYEIGTEKYTSYTDWIGPFNVYAVNKPVNSTYGFTGGWHGSNGDGTGNPTAQTQSIEVSMDGEAVEDGTHQGKEAVCVVYNKIEAANTKFDDAKRFVLSETVTYTFTGGRLYVKVDIEALEDVDIRIYYGMQIAGGYCKKFTFTTSDGQTSECTESYFAKGDIREMTGYSTGGHLVKAHMYDEGLGSFEKATKEYHALTQYYGATNGKGYYMLIGDMNAASNSYRLKKDEKLFWRGFYEFNKAE